MYCLYFCMCWTMVMFYICSACYCTSASSHALDTVYLGALHLLTVSWSLTHHWILYVRVGLSPLNLCSWSHCMSLPIKPLSVDSQVIYVVFSIGALVVTALCQVTCSFLVSLTCLRIWKVGFQF